MQILNLDSWQGQWSPMEGTVSQHQSDCHSEPEKFPAVDISLRPGGSSVSQHTPKLGFDVWLAWTKILSRANLDEEPGSQLEPT